MPFSYTELLSNLLLFSLVFGMSATVDYAHIQSQLHNRAALLIGLSLQFLVLPFVGFLVVTLFFRHDPARGLVLLVITSSPGGSYSNWWCSLFNADLALSVTMTAVSTLLSTCMLPLNVYLYSQAAYNGEVTHTSVNFTKTLYVSIGVVMGGIGAGMCVSARKSSTTRRHANRMGNVAGCLLILVSILVHQRHTKNTASEESTEQQPSWTLYLATALPPCVGMIMAFFLAYHVQLPKPECVAVAIESCNQNTGIATTVALGLFTTGGDLQAAMSVPLVYGIVSMMVNCVVLMTCWKQGWTKAPAKAQFWTMLMTSYEVNEQEAQQQEEAIEVVLSSSKKQLIFARGATGDYIVDEATLQHDDTERLSSSSSDVEEEAVLEEGRLPPQQQPSNTHRKKRLLGRTISKLRARTAGYRLPPAAEESLSAELFTAPPPSVSYDDDDDECCSTPEPSRRSYATVSTAGSPEQRFEPQSTAKTSRRLLTSYASVPTETAAKEETNTSPDKETPSRAARLLLSSSYTTVPTTATTDVVATDETNEDDDDNLSL